MAGLSQNPNAIHLLEKNIDKINWTYLSYNPNAIHLLEKNIDKINWSRLSNNPNIFEKIGDHIKPFKEELIMKALHPKRVINWIENDIDF